MKRLWVRECAWFVLDEHGRAPTWEELAAEMVEFVPCDREDADLRILKALKREEVWAFLDDDMEWCIDIGPTSAADPPWLTRRLADRSRT